MFIEHPCRACGRMTHTSGTCWDSRPDAHQLGPMIYCTMKHTCVCGLSLPIFVALNDMLVAAGDTYLSVEEALVEVEMLLPPQELERGLIETRCLLHRGDEAEAVLMAEGLAQRYPDRPECLFNAGCARQRLGDAAEALAHYRRSLALHPQLAGAWLNRGLLLGKLGRLQEARFCFSRVRQAGSDLAPPESSPRVLCEIAGTFDVLRVLEDEDVRALFIGQQCQGAVFRHVDDNGPQPGPFAYSPFTTGWLLAGCRYPQGYGLMLGLGSGAGAVTLLSNFPGLRLRVIEIDGKLIELALEYFPRLASLCKQGRLEIVHADAQDEVSLSSEAVSPAYDFALLDLFTGTQEFPRLLEQPDFLTKLGANTRMMLANAIFTFGSDIHRSWLHLFDAAGYPIESIYPTSGPEQWSTRPNNWILSTARIEQIESFVPFADSSHFVAMTIRDDFRSMCSRAMQVPHLMAAQLPSGEHPQGEIKS